MSKDGQIRQQTAGIGQAVVLIVVVLGALQLAASSLLIRSGASKYLQAIEHAKLNAANLDVFMLASAINSENDAQLSLLSLTSAPSDKDMTVLRQARANTDLRLQHTLLRLGHALEPDVRTALQQLQDRRQHLQQRRQQADKVLTRQPFVFDENAIFGWKLSISAWQDSIDKVLRLDTFHLSDGADERLNRLAETKYQVWQLSRALGQEGNAMIVRAHFARKLNSTDEYELVRSRERALLILESLRYSIDYLGDDTLKRLLRQVAERGWFLHQTADLQLASLDGGTAMPLSVNAYARLTQDSNHDVTAFFARLTDVAAARVVEQQHDHALNLLLNIAFSCLALILYVYLLFRMRFRILRPLHRMQRVLDAAADAILTVNSEHRIQVANYGAEKMFGIPIESLQGQLLDSLLSVEQPSADWLDDEGYFDLSRSGTGHRADGSQFFASVTVSPLQDHHQPSRTRLLIIRDEQQRKVAEISLARSMQLLSAIHHVESLLFARSPRQMVFREVLQILLDYFSISEGLVLSLEAAKEKSALFRVQARQGQSAEPAWVERFRSLPLGVALQLGQQQQMVSEGGWTFIPVQVDTRTIMVAGLAIDSVSAEHYQALQPLLGACGSIVSFYAEEDRRRASERHLREVLQLEEAIYSASPVGLMRVDRNYTIIRANRAGEQLFGTGEDGLQGLPLRELLSASEEWQLLRQQLEKARLEEGYLSIETECVQVGGKPVWVLFAGQLLFPGLVDDGMILACFDITDRRAAEEGILRARDAAAEARQQLELAIDSLDEAFALFDAADNLVLCNGHYARLTGSDVLPAMLKGRSFGSLLHDKMRSGEHAEPGFDGPAWYQERLARYAQPSSAFELRWNEQWLQQTSRRVPDGGAVCVLTDITALKRQQADLLLARDQADAANRAKSAFLAAMSHEIRTPMNGVLGMLELLTLTPLDEAQRDSVDTVQESARTLLRLIDDILDFSKIEAGKLEIATEAASVRALMTRVHHLYAELAERKQLGFVLEIDEAVAPALLLDPLRLRQILQNFCSNALKFTQQGQVTLRVRCLAASGPEQTLRFEVVDTGIGIDAAQLVSLFEPFTQAENTTARRYGGTGLGLTICRRLSELMHGQVGIDSTPGQGSVAWLDITLPVCDAADIEQAPEEVTLGALLRQPSATQNKLPVLFVEDNPTNRKLTLKQFELLGYPVVAAEDGIAALSLWQDQPFAMVLTDCHMPQMDGYELARTLRQLEAMQGQAPMPIVACTANAAKEEVEKTRAAGMDDFMTKPLSLAALKSMLEKWLPSQPETAVSAGSGTPAVTPAVPAAAVVLDRSTLAVYSAGDWSVERAILDEFMPANDDDVAALSAAVDNGDLERIAWSAHRIKGASRMVGALALGDMAEALEKAARHGDSAQITTLWPSFGEALQDLRDWLAAQPA